MNNNKDTTAPKGRKRLFFVLAGFAVLIITVAFGFELSIRSLTAKLSEEANRINQHMLSSFQAKQIDQDSHSRGGLFEKLYDCSIYTSTECGPYVTTNFTMPIDTGTEAKIGDLVSGKIGYAGLNPDACSDGSRECSFVFYKNDFRLVVYIQPGASVNQATVRLKLTYKN